MHRLLAGRILFYKASLALLMSSNDPRMALARGITNSLCNHRPTNYRLSTTRKTIIAAQDYLSDIDVNGAFNQPFHFRYIDPGKVILFPESSRFAFEILILGSQNVKTFVLDQRSPVQLKHTPQKLLVERNTTG